MIILSASIAKGTTGFGFALISTPFLLLIWETSIIVAVLVPLVMTLDILIVFQGRTRLDWKRVTPMITGAFLGIPLGTVLLLTIPENILKLTIAGVVLLFAILLLRGYTLRIRHDRIVGSIAGFFSGALLTSTSLSGPPITLYMINQKWDKDTFRTSQGLFHLITDILGTASLIATGIITIDTLTIGIALFPAVLIGYVISIFLLPRIPKNLFLRITTGIVVTAALLALGSELIRI